jgi:hypothetical protein
LSLKEIQIDRSPFPINKLDLENPDILIQPEQANTTKGKNVIIGHPRLEEDAKSTPSHKVVMEKLPDGEETITITISGSMTGNHETKAEGSTSARDNGKWKPTAADWEQAVRLPWPTQVGNIELWSDYTQSRSNHVQRWSDCPQGRSDRPASEQGPSDDEASKSGSR